MRGKVDITHYYDVSYGITPAYAGKSHYQNQRGIWAEDHPPPMRGKVGIKLFTFKIDGITPAYAGKR